MDYTSWDESGRGRKGARVGSNRQHALARLRAAMDAHPLGTALAVLAAALVLLAVLPADTLFALAAQSAIMAAFALAATALIQPRRLARPRFRETRSWRTCGAVFYLLAVAAVAGGLSLAALAAGGYPGGGAGAAAPVPAVLAFRVTLAVIVCLGTGIFEEGVFRAIALEALMAALPPGPAVRLRAAAWSAAVFGVLHISGVPASGLLADAPAAVIWAQCLAKPLEAALFGFVMAAWYFRTRSLWPVAGAHAAFDALSVAPSLVVADNVPSTYITGSAADLAVLSAVTLLLIPPAVAAWRELRIGAGGDGGGRGSSV